MYGLEVVDSICETIGRILLDGTEGTIKPRSKKIDCDIILVSGLVPGGGEVFREVSELALALEATGSDVYIISSNFIPTAASAFEDNFSSERIKYIVSPHKRSSSATVRFIMRTILKLRPRRVFPFVTHNDVALDACIQDGLPGEVILDYVYDHGLSLAIHNSSIDTLIVKTESQAKALRPAVPEKKIMLAPVFLRDKFGENLYRPLRNGVLTTASAAARSYKVKSPYKISYFNLAVEMMRRTGCRHIHYGPLKFAALVSESLISAGVPVENFTHIAWADNFGASLIANGVDVFISPFPVCSARISVEVMSCGIPSINHMGGESQNDKSVDFV